MPASSSSSASSYAVGAGGVTLAQIEWELALRTGPAAMLTAAAGTANTVVVADLQSTIDQGGWTGLHVLRRGKDAAGVDVPGFDAGDRVRRVKEYAPETGTLTVDRNYANAVVAGEAVEVVHLHPARELRVAAQKGLWRCYFEDRVAVTAAGLSPERNLTASLPWLTKRGQVRGVVENAASALYLPSSVQYVRPFERAGQVWVALDPDVYPYQALVSVLRPAASYVNGADSATGPTDDDDVLVVDLNYAAAVAHMEAWRYFPYRLQPLADGRIYLTKEGARNVKNQEVAANLGDVRPDRVAAPRFAGVMT